MTDTLSVEEQRARIERLRADVTLKLLDSIKRARDIRFAPFTMLITGAGAGPALTKWIG